MPKFPKFALAILFVSPQLAIYAVRAAVLEPITPRDCATVRRIPDDPTNSPIQINPQHTLVAYLVNSPNLTTNENDVQLYIRSLRKSGDEESVFVLTGIEMHDLRWLGDGTHLLAKLNPQFDQLRIAPTQTFSWQTSDGLKIQGTLWLPPNYREGTKYPLVIQTKPDAGDFACDSGGNHDPSFAPQPIADAGMIYIARTWPQNFQYADDAAHYPKGYPGGIAEAAFHMDIWDSAVRALVEKGIIDPNRVGIIGFSRAGWYTEFILAHSKIRYHAATAADNVLYSVGDYWLHQTERAVRDGEILYGGPPYGSTLDNWQKYSISFNMEKIHTPLLMEVFGEGIQYISGRSIPDVLAPSFEITTAMAHFKTPAALYYYPNDVHQPNHPQTRLASLQRNLDWYRFWLQGYERSDPETANQYMEWRALKGIQANSVNQLPREP